MGLASTSVAAARVAATRGGGCARTRAPTAVRRAPSRATHRPPSTAAIARRPLPRARVTRLTGRGTCPASGASPRGSCTAAPLRKRGAARSGSQRSARWPAHGLAATGRQA
eukprot:7322174-Prymnesium_polylepis.1